jgi:hypothetical protein
MLDGTSSGNPTIKPRWYEKGEGASYAIVQHKVIQLAAYFEISHKFFFTKIAYQTPI